MRKLLIAVAAFFVSATAGLILLVVGSFLLAILPQLAQQHTSGIGAVAGGVSGTAVLFVPILCGILGTVFALRRFNRQSIQTAL